MDEISKVSRMTPPQPLRVDGERIATLEARVEAHDKDIERVLDAVNDHLRFCRTDLETRKKDRHELRNEITGALGELRGDMEDGLDRLSKEIGEVREKVEINKSRFLWWIIAVGGTVILMLVGALAWTVPRAFEPPQSPSFYAPYVPGGIGAQ